MQIAEAFVAIRPDTKGFQQDAQRQIGNPLKAVAASAVSAFAAVKVKDLFSDAIRGASSLNETISKSNTIFGEGAGKIERWAEGAAEGFGQSKQQALDAASTFGNLFTQIGVGTAQAGDLSTSMVELASDFASFHNADITQVLEAQTSAFRGEYDALQRFVPTINAANVEQRALADTGKKATSELTAQEKALATYALMMEGAGDAAGDFERTSDSLANQQRKLSAEWEDAQAQIGSVLIPAMTDLVGVGSDVLGVFTELPSGVQTATLGLLGLVAVSGPILSMAGNVRALGAAVAGLNPLVLAAAAAAATAAAGWNLWTETQKVQGKAWDGIADSMAKYVNNTALAENGAANFDRALADQNAALAAGEISFTEYLANGVKTTTMALGDADEAQREFTESVRKAQPILRELSRESGVTQQRIADLATEMGINLADASDEQRAALGAAITEISRATTPTERLAAVQATLGDEFATTAEEVKAFEEAVEAALGVHLTAEEASIRYRQAIRDLRDEIKAGRQEGEDRAEMEDRLRLGMLEVVDAAQREVDALVRSGDISTDVADQKNALIYKLADLRNKFPELAAQIDEYIGHLQNLGPEAKEAGAAVPEGLAQGIEEGRVRVINAAVALGTAAITAARATLKVFSPSRVFQEIGEFTAEGLAIGIDAKAVLAEERVTDLASFLAEAMTGAAEVTREEEIAILQAHGRVVSAQTALNDARKDATTTAEELRLKELELAEAQDTYNQRVNDSVSVTNALDEAMRAASRSVSDVLGLLGAGGSREDAQEDLAEARSEVARLERRRRDLPGQIRAAEQTVEKWQQATRRGSKEDRERARELVKTNQERVRRLQQELGGIPDALREAREELRDAQERAIRSEQGLRDARSDTTFGPDQEAILRDVGRSAGLTDREIADLIAAARGLNPSGGTNYNLIAVHRDPLNVADEMRRLSLLRPAVRTA